jgi:hypothetical protein
MTPQIFSCVVFLKDQFVLFVHSTKFLSSTKEDAFRDATLITGRKEGLRNTRYSSLESNAAVGAPKSEVTEPFSPKMTFLRHSRDTVTVGSLYSSQEMNPSVRRFPLILSVRAIWGLISSATSISI